MKMRVGEIAGMAGVSVRTIRYYDDIGLLKPAGVDDNGYRFYDESSVETLKKILYCREIDMPLKDISEVMGEKKHINVKLMERRLALAEQKRHIERLISEIDDRLSKPVKVDNWFDKITGDYNHSCFVCDNDYFCAWGKADYENDKPFRLDSRFPAGGITRLFTIFCALIFEDMGLLDTDDFLNRYMEEFIYGDKVKIHHLMTMSSGISEKLWEDRWNEAIEKEFSLHKEKLNYEAGNLTICKKIRPLFLKKKSYDEILEIINYEPLKFTPGEEFDYREINSEILGIILEKVSGKTIDKIFEEYIFKPLKMNDTSFYGNVDIIGYCVDTPVKTNYDCDGGKGIITTAEDLGKWCSALIEGKLTSEKGRKCFESDIFCDRKHTEYGRMGEVHIELSIDMKEGTYSIYVRNKLPVPDKNARVMYYPIISCDDGYVKFEVWTMQSNSEVRVDSIRIFDKNAEELFSVESPGLIYAKNDGEERHASDFVTDGSYYYEMNLSDILKDKFDNKTTYFAEVRAQCSEYKYAQLGAVHLRNGEWQSLCFNAFFCYESANDLFNEAINSVCVWARDNEEKTDRH
ncbi:MAG: serine hydrolase [Oscillospiraceae bacterium]|nr:serine hydrolase [Oscillospiraceae bacterium]